MLLIDFDLKLILVVSTMKFKKVLALCICISAVSCGYAKPQKPSQAEVEKCIPNDSKYVERCNLKEAKETYHKKEVEYYFYQVGEGKFEKQLPQYAKDYIENANLYCAMKTAYSFVEVPKEDYVISEKVAQCLNVQYKQLGTNLRSFTDTATETIMEQVKKSIEEKEAKFQH